MIYIIGVNHGVQYTTTKNTVKQLDIIKKFTSYLNDLIKKENIKVIAEEMSLEALKEKNTLNCIAEKISKDQKLQHLFCDPSRKERIEKNIDNNEKREEEWLDRLKKYVQDYKKIDILFICGNQHIHNFSELLNINQITSRIISKDWGEDEFEPKFELNFFD